MPDEVVALKYTDTALPAISETVTLFDTTAMLTSQSFPHWLTMTGLRWFKYSIWNDQAGTVNFSESDDGGTTWRVFKTTALAIASSESNTDSQLVEGKRDVKVEFVNGATAQTAFNVHLSLAQRT